MPNLEEIHKGICRDFPITDYVQEICNRPAYTTHNYFSRKRKRILADIRRIYGLPALAAYQKLALAHVSRLGPNAGGITQQIAIVRNVAAWAA